jgi:hypothetical protein
MEKDVGKRDNNIVDQAYHQGQHFIQKKRWNSYLRL